MFCTKFELAVVLKLTSLKFVMWKRVKEFEPVMRQSLQDFIGTTGHMAVHVGRVLPYPSF